MCMQLEKGDLPGKEVTEKHKHYFFSDVSNYFCRSRD